MTTDDRLTFVAVLADRIVASAKSYEGRDSAYWALRDHAVQHDVSIADALVQLAEDNRRLRGDVVSREQERDHCEKVIAELEEQIDGMSVLVKVTPTRVRMLADENDRLMAENVVLREAADKLRTWAKAGMAEAAATGDKFILRAWHCIWCGEGGPTTDGDSSDAKAHDRVCQANPQAVEVVKLRAALVEMADIAEIWGGSGEGSTDEERIAREKRFADLRQLAEAAR